VPGNSSVKVSRCIVQFLFSGAFPGVSLGEADHLRSGARKQMVCLTGAASADAIGLSP